MKYYFAIVLAMMAPCINAQYQVKVDSLEQLLDKVDGHEKIVVLRDLCYYSSRFDFEKSIGYGEAAVALALELSDLRDIGGAYNDLATAHMRANRLATSLAYYDQSLRAFKAIDDLKQQSFILNNIGTVYKNQGNHNEALNYYFQSLAIRDALGNVQTGTVLNNIGLIYKDDEDPNQALPYFHKAMAQDIAENDLDGLSFSYNNLGITHEKLGNYDSALYYANKAYAIDKAEGNTYSIAIDLNNLGEVYLDLNQLDLAIAYFDSSLAIKYELNNTIGIAHTSGRLAFIYQQKGEFRKALDYADDALRLAMTNGNKDKEMTLHLLKADISEAEGDHINALAHHRAYSRIKDEIYDRDKALMAADLATKYQSEKKQAENDLLKAKNEQQAALIQRRELLTIAAVVGVLLLAILATVLYRAYQQKTKSNAQLKLQKEELTRVNHTKDKFFGIIAHDLRGPLTALQGISGLLTHTIIKGDYEKLNKIAGQVEKSALQVNTLLDNLLQWALHQSGNISYRPEKLNLKDIIDESLGYFNDMAAAKGITIFNEVQNGLLITADKESMATVIRNLINNGIKFTPQGGQIHLSAVVASHHVKINIKDTGLGMAPEKLHEIFQLRSMSSGQGTENESGTGLGLILVKDFIKMNHGSLEVSSTPNVGSTFSVIVPAA